MKLNRIERKKLRIRSKLKKNAGSNRFRLSVSRSLKNISAQIIDDKKNETLVSASSREKLISDNKNLKKILIAENVGKLLAEKALKKGIKDVTFDRSGYLYHGRVKSLAKGARSGGLKF